MEPAQIGDAHSPRIQYELNQELTHSAGDNHFQFEQGSNPFSYYDQDNRRETHSSDQEPHSGNHAQEEKSPHSSNNKVEVKSGENVQSPFKNVDIPDNLAEKPPISLLPTLSSPKGSPKKVEKQVSKPVPSISMIKEAEFNLGSLEKAKQKPATRPLPATDRAYKSELDSDMLELKKKILNKDQKKKQSKPNFNKTVQPVPKKQSKDANTIQFEEMRMLIKMGFEKKKTNYQMLKEWDRKRAEALALHGRISELLQNQVDIRIKSSLQNFQHYQTFFRQKAKQQQKYASSPVINTKYALQNNSLSKNVYINCSVILNSLCDENTTRCKKINDFIQLIRNGILRQLTENHLNTSQKELLKVREKISTLKSSLNKYNMETEERANQLATLFNQQSNNITNTSQKDFYRTQLSFLRKALHQIEVQRKLGEYCLEYYHTAVQEELKRSQVIREAMVTYSKGLKITYNLEPQLDHPQLQQMSKQEEIKLIQQFYSLDEMFDQRTLQLFKQKNEMLCDDEISIDQFTRYITSFNYNSFDSRLLLLKQFNVRYIQGKGKDIGYQPCHLVMTVDNFLHMFLNASKENISKPDITIKISSKQLDVRPGKEEVLEIVKKEERRGSVMSYFWDSKVEKVYRFKFLKKDSRQEFIDYISKLMVDQF